MVSTAFPCQPCGLPDDGFTTDRFGLVYALGSVPRGASPVPDSAAQGTS